MLGAEYVLLLNNDTEIARDMISILVAALKENERVGFQVRIFLPGSDRRLWAVGGVFRDHRVITWGINMVDSERNDFRGLDFVFGCAMIVRRAVFEQIGLFDVGFHFYFEDIDLCLRAKQAGSDVVWVPNAITWHLNPIETQSASRFSSIIMNGIGRISTANISTRPEDSGLPSLRSLTLCESGDGRLGKVVCGERIGA